MAQPPLSPAFPVPQSVFAAYAGAAAGSALGPAASSAGAVVGFDSRAWVTNALSFDAALVVHPPAAPPAPVSDRGLKRDKHAPEGDARLHRRHSRRSSRTPERKKKKRRQRSPGAPAAAPARKRTDAEKVAEIERQLAAGEAGGVDTHRRRAAGGGFGGKAGAPAGAVGSHFFDTRPDHGTAAYGGLYRAAVPRYARAAWGVVLPSVVSASAGEDRRPAAVLLASTLRTGTGGGGGNTSVGDPSRHEVLLLPPMPATATTHGVVGGRSRGGAAPPPVGTGRYFGPEAGAASRDRRARREYLASATPVHGPVGTARPPAPGLGDSGYAPLAAAVADAADGGVTREERDLMTARSLNEATRARPGDVASWLALASHAGTAPMPHGSAPTTDRRLAVLECARRAAGPHPALVLALLASSSETETPGVVASRWESALSRSPGCGILWRAHATLHVAGRWDGYTSGAARAAHGRGLSALAAECGRLRRSGAPAASVRHAEEAWCDATLAASRCDLLSGHTELAVARLQAAVEYACFSPPGVDTGMGQGGGVLMEGDECAASAASGGDSGGDPSGWSLMDSQRRRLFGVFWDSGAPRWGEPGGVGWRHWLQGAMGRGEGTQPTHGPPLMSHPGEGKAPTAAAAAAAAFLSSLGGGDDGGGDVDDGGGNDVSDEPPPPEPSVWCAPPGAETTMDDTTTADGTIPPAPTPPTVPPLDSGRPSSPPDTGSDDTGGSDTGDDSDGDSYVASDDSDDPESAARDQLLADAGEMETDAELLEKLGLVGGVDAAGGERLDARVASRWVAAEASRRASDWYPARPLLAGGDPGGVDTPLDRVVTWGDLDQGGAATTGAVCELTRPAARRLLLRALSALGAPLDAWRTPSQSLTDAIASAEAPGGTVLSPLVTLSPLAGEGGGEDASWMWLGSPPPQTARRGGGPPDDADCPGGVGGWCDGGPGRRSFCGRALDSACAEFPTDDSLAIARLRCAAAEDDDDDGSGGLGRGGRAKAVLSSSPQSLAVWAAWAEWEAGRGRLSAARRVVDKAIKAVPCVSGGGCAAIVAACPSSARLVWAASWMEVTQTPSDPLRRAMSLLTCFGGGDSLVVVGGGGGDVANVRARRGYSTLLARVTATAVSGRMLPPWAPAAVGCAALHAVLGEGPVAAATLLAEVTAAAPASVQRQSPRWAAIHALAARVMALPCCTPALPPRVRRTSLLTSLSVFPESTALLAALANCERSVGATSRLRRWLALEDSRAEADAAVGHPTTGGDDAPSEAARLARVVLSLRLDGGTALTAASASRVKSRLERALRVPRCAASPLLWRLYLECEMRRPGGGAIAARRVYLRAVHACPASLALWLDAARRLRGSVGGRELGELCDLMKAKGLRSRVDIYEALLQEQAEADATRRAAMD